MRNPTIQELRNAGFKVSIRHHRVWRFKAPKDVVIMKHEDAWEVSQLEEAAKLQSPAISIGWKLCVRGGYTQVVLTTPESFKGGEKEYEGVARCHEDDCFVKLIGRTTAMGKALQQIKGFTSINVTPALCMLLFGERAESAVEEGTTPDITLVEDPSEVMEEARPSTA